jgi:hypothetical protein
MAPTAISLLGLGLDRDPLFSDLIEAVRAAAIELGIETRGVTTSTQAAGADRLLLVGRPGRYGALLGGHLPRRIVWTGEPLPPDRAGPTAASPAGAAGSRRLPPRVVRGLGTVARGMPLPGPLDRRRVSVAVDRLVRANLEELEAAAASGVRIVVTSRDRGRALESHGLAATVVPFGYHERHAGPLTPADAGPRDVPMLMLGSRATHTRRARELGDLRRTREGRHLHIADGVWGHDRAALLRRTRVVVDIHRIPGNFVGMRLLLAIAAGAVVVTEPMTDPFPFVPGVHHLEATLEDLLPVAAELAGDDRRRADMVEAGQALLRGDLAMRVSLGRVLEWDGVAAGAGDGVAAGAGPG